MMYTGMTTADSIDKIQVLMYPGFDVPCSQCSNDLSVVIGDNHCCLF